MSMNYKVKLSLKVDVQFGELVESCIVVFWVRRDPKRNLRVKIGKIYTLYFTTMLNNICNLKQLQVNYIFAI